MAAGATICSGPPLDPLAVREPLVLHEDIRVAARGRDELGGQGWQLRGRIREDLALGEEAALQAPVGVGNFEAHAEGAAVLLHGRAHLGQGGAEGAIEARHAEGHLHAHLDAGKGLRGQIRQDLQLAVVHHHEGSLAGAEHLARLHGALGHLAGEGRHGAGLLEAGAGQPQVALSGAHGGAVGVEGRLGLLRRLARDTALLQQVLGPVVVALGLIGLGLGLGELRLGGLDREQQLVLILGAQHGPRLNAVALLHGHARRAPRDFRLQLRPVHGHQRAREGDGASEGVVLHGHEGHGHAAHGLLVALAPQLAVAQHPVVAGGSGDEEDRHADIEE